MRAETPGLMPTRSVTMSITINATPAKVWDVITRIDTITDWYDTWDRVVCAESATVLCEGTSFQLVRSRGRREEMAQFVVTQLSPYTRMQWVQSTPNQPSTTVTFDLVPLPHDGGTELHQTRSWSLD